MRTRIADNVQSECLASVLALETRRGQESVDQAIFVACDLVAIRDGVIEKVRERLKDRLPGFPVSKLIMSATHTHTAPATEIGADDLPARGVMRPEQYIEFLVERVADAVAQAWQGRAPGSVGWGLGHAVVAQNRRAVYEDGRAQMYGKTDAANFRRFRRIRGPRRRGALFLEPRGATGGDGSQRSVPGSGSGRPVGRERRFLAPGAPVAARQTRRAPARAWLDRRRG